MSKSTEPTAERTATPPTDERDSVSGQLEFGWPGLGAGVRAGLPVALGVAGYGVVFGALARDAGLSAAEATLMSATVMAGAAQLVAVELWADPVPVLAVVGTTLVVNLRYLLMGAALRPWFQTLSPARAYGSVFFTADENWALTVRELQSGSRRGAFLLGSGLAVWALWVLATVLGATLGEAVGPPARYGLDFALTAVFVAILASLWERQRTPGWVVAGVVALATATFLPGRWYVLCGALAGALAEVAR
jgi:4-azaleucine resistance transporter AzlC